MSKSYTRNIQRLRANQASISAQEQGITTETARTRGEYEIAHAKDIANKLTPFSKALQDWKDKDIEKKIEEGKLELDKAQAENAKWLEEHGSEHQKKILALEKKIAESKAAQKRGELEYEIQDSQAQDIELQRLKTELLMRQGVNGYPDADRLAQLSPWQQVGYAQQDIKNKKNAFGDMLAHSMQNGQEQITLGRISYNAAEINDNKLAFQMKQHAVHYYSDKIYRNLGLDKYSQEMLERGGVAEHIRKTKESQISKHRTQYNIESSANTQKKAILQWNEGPKTAKDMEHFLLVYGATVDKNNNLHGHAGALDALFNQIVAEGVANGGNTQLMEKYKDAVIPDSIRLQMGLKPGTTFGDHWKGRFNNASAAILDQNANNINQERKILKADLTALENQLIRQIRTDPASVDRKMLDNYKRMSTALGIKSDFIENFMTTQDREIDIQKDTIQERIDTQNGFISHAQLNEYHPEAATKYREQATKLENAHKKKHNVDGKIKAALNRTWTDAGMTSKEKPVVWEYALARATQDYERKFNQLVEIGYPPDIATKLALDGPPGGANDKEGQPMANFQGVVNEILQNGPNSRYTQEGEDALNSIADAHIRVDAINKGKLELLQEVDAIDKTIIGGKYGKDRLNEIIENIEKYGTWRGLSRSEHAMNFYDGLSRGKRQLSAHGIIDRQLKLMGHPGLYPERTVQVPDPDGNIEAANDALQPTKYEGSADTYNTITEDTLDLMNYYSGTSSRWNQRDNIPTYYGGDY